MFDIQELITHVNNEVGLTCDWAAETQPVIDNIEELQVNPKVFLGGWLLNRRSDILMTGSTDPYEQYGEDLTFTISVHLVTVQKNLYSDWTKLYKGLLGWTPYDAREKEFSGLTYSEGGMMGITNGRSWWLDKWVLSFPAVTLNQS